MTFTWDVDPILLDRGVTPLRYYSLIFALTITGGVLLWLWQMRRAGHKDEVSGIFVAYGMVGTVVGARVLHCLFYDLQRSISEPLFLFQIWLGGLSSHGAVAGLAIAAILYSRRHKLPLPEVCDRLSLSAALPGFTIRVANFFNSEIVGRVTDGSWGIRFPRHDAHLPLALVPLRHPSQLYEATFGLAIFLLLLWLDRRNARGTLLPRGLLTALLITLYFGARITVEFFKERQVFSPAFPLSMGQLLSFAPLLLGLVWLLRIRKQNG